ncbi:BON domain-containing protein [Pedobacter cryoconitis]|uniref:Osmotically-inducible protein OsmY n=1 Tax=Pedobacter cryoconitis TaxID=188932 RepID=A0A327S1Q0_9SPHI|nr:BON domain-containing protein [Pedobacter cryoconitis]MBB5638369.1 osmotically-inducible protein OsmY [Pedobacter cryoconitis]RAJ22608.1 osmotically-inducible protein OsmY [Pedobacter cryoconitis]
MKNNETLQKNVQDAIKWEPLLHAAEIGVTANDGVVTLTGIVDSYAKKSEAEDAAKKVAGVKAVVERIEVKYLGSIHKEDEEIAKEVLNAFKWNWKIPGEKITVKVEDGWVTLTGTINWNYQKDAAKNAIKNLLGVKGVTNSITIESDIHDAVEKKEIEDAIDRNWSVNNQDIQVKVSGSRVTLTGTVNSIYQKDEAQRMAWNAPGVWYVDNEIEIEYDYLLVD